MREVSSIFGDKEVQKILEEIAPRHANNLMRATIHGVASTIAKKVKQTAPKDTGILRKGVKAKRRKSKPGFPISDVIIKSAKGRKSAFYWRFVEYGTSGNNPQSARPFVSPVVNEEKSKFTATLKKQFGLKLEKALAREAKKMAKK